MNSLDSLGELYRHMQWADAQMWISVSATPNAAADTTLRDKLQHMHLVQQIFVHNWRGDAFDHQAASSSHTELTAICDWGRQYHADVAGFLATLDENSLDRPVILPWAAMIAAQIGREIATPTLRETMFQVVTHSTHHRGQVASRLRELGGKPAGADFIRWVWVGKPQAEWPRLPA